MVFAVAILDAVDQRRLDLLAAIGDDGIGGDETQNGRFAGAERHCKKRRHLVVDPETFGIFGDDVHPQVVGEPYRHQVTRFLDAETQRRRSGRTAAIVLGPPDLAAGNDLDRRIQNDRCRRIAVVEGRSVDEGLESGAGLAHCLGCTVEFGLPIGEPADHSQHAAGMRIHCDQPTLHFRRLAQPILARLFQRLDIDNVARSDDPFRRFCGLALSACGAIGPLHVLRRDTPGHPFRHDLARGLLVRLDTDFGAFAIHRKDNRQFPFRHVAEPRNLAQRLSPVAADLDRFYRTVKATPLVIAQKPGLQRLACRDLQPWIQRRAHGKPALVKRLVTVFLNDLPTHLLGKEVGSKKVCTAAAGRDAERLLFCLFAVGLGDISRFRPCDL